MEHAAGSGRLVLFCSATTSVSFFEPFALLVGHLIVMGEQMLKRSFLFTLVFGLFVVSSAWAQWPNEPTGSTVLLDHNFDTILGSGMSNPYNAGQIVSMSEPGMLSPGAAYKSSVCAGCATGGTELHWNSNQIYSELFVGIVWRTNAEFQGRVVGNKMFFVRGPNSNHVWNFNDSILLGGTGPMIWGHNSGNYDNSHACSYLYGATCYPNVGGPSLHTGVWTKLEAYVKKSNTLTSRDGIVRWWINGQLSGNYTNLNVAADGINNWVWSETWDGSGNMGNTVEWAHYLDHLYISVPNCPAGGCSIPDNPPPPVDPPPPSGTTLSVSDLEVVSSTADSITLSFTETDNGQGLPASYDIRVQSPTISWGAAASVASGTCTSPVAGTTIGNVKTCVVSGLQAETNYEFQLIPFRGVMNQGATYGSLSNVASGQTLAANSNPPPDSNPPPSDPPPANNPGDVNGDGTANVNCHDENGQRVCDVDAKGTVNGCSATHAMPVWFAAAMSLALRRRKATS